MKKFQSNMISILCFILLSFIILLFYYLSESLISYIISSLMVFFVIHFFRGFYDLKSPISLFNYFYFFFVIFGFFCESMLRGFNPNLGGMILISILSFNLLLPFKSYSKIKIENYDIRNKELLVILSSVFCFVSILASFIYFFKQGGIPLFSSSSPEDRIKAMTGMGYLLQPMRFGPISALIIYLCVSDKNKKYSIMIFFVCNFLLLGIGFRGTFFQNLILLIITVSLVGNFKIGFVKSAKIGVLLIFFIVIIGFFRGDGAAINGIMMKVAHAVSVSIYILDIVVSNYDDYKYGVTFFYKFSSLLPMESIEFTQWLTTKLPLRFSGGVTPTIVGDMYINFGGFYWLGMFFIGLFTIYIEKIILRSKCNYLVLFLMLNISLGLARTATGGLSNTLFQTFLSCIFIFVFIIISKFKKA